MTHPFLADPERRRAYEHLTAVPTGSIRKWAQHLGWSKDQMQRFIDGLRRYRLGDVVTCSNRSTFTPGEGVADCSGLSRTVAPPLGSSGVLVKSPREISGKKQNDEGATVPWSAFAGVLIVAQNDEFGRISGAGYRTVLPDNRASHRTGHTLEREGVDLEWAEQELRFACRQFNPSKHGGGDLPRTLAYFEKGLVRDWRRHRAELAKQQIEMPLLAVERSHPKADAGMGDGPASDAIKAVVAKIGMAS